jgi:NAD-dependent SIR2 family protein deacetylase
MGIYVFNASDIIFFFGAGASAAFGIPTMKKW